jgi:hypothetical protein
MKVRLPLYTASLASIMLIGSNSEALFSNSPYSDTSNSGYHCRSGYQQKKVTVHQQEDDMYTLTCRVSWQHNSRKETVLWNSQRNMDNCKKNASAIVMRVKDRGWQCKSIWI